MRKEARSDWSQSYKTVPEVRARQAYTRFVLRQALVLVSYVLSPFHARFRLGLRDRGLELRKHRRRREVKAAKRIARAALAFAFGVLVAPLLPFMLAWFAAKEDE